jgi:hypothetical protein
MIQPIDTVNLRSALHGGYQCKAADLDRAMSRYLPATMEELARQITERQGEIQVWKITSLTEGLMILAELDGYATN